MRFVGPSYELKKRKADVQRSVNLMPTPVESGDGKSNFFLKPVPGLTRFDPPPCTPAAGLPVVFGSGVNAVYDPDRNEIWSIWRCDGTPARPTGMDPGEPAPANAHYVLVYSASTFALLDIIDIGGVTIAIDLLFITMLNGYIWAGVSSKGLLTSPTQIPYIVTQINPATRTIVGGGNCGWASAFLNIGLVSHDGSNLYVSGVDGIGNGTSIASQTAPHTLGVGVSNSGLLWSFVYVEQTNVRAYTGFNNVYMDLRGAVNMAVNLSTYFTSSGSLPIGSYRLAVKGPYIFATQVDESGVIRVDSRDGSVTVVEASTSSSIIHAMYFSPDTNRLYLEIKDRVTLVQSIKVYSATTLMVIGTLSADYAVAIPYVLGTAGIYLGCETFACCESTSADLSRMWNVSFPLELS